MYKLKRIRPFLPLAIIFAVALLGGYFLRDYLSFTALSENRDVLLAWRDQHYITLMGIFILTYIIIVAFSLPGATVMTLTGGFLFAVFPGVLFNLLGASIGAILIFLIAKSSLGDVLYKKFISDTKVELINRMEKELRDNEISYLFLMRLVPVVPFFISNLVPAFFGVRLRNFAITTFFGILPGCIVYTSVGAGLGAIFETGETPNLNIIFEWQILMPILALCALSIVSILIKKMKRTRHGTD